MQMIMASHSIRPTSNQDIAAGLISPAELGLSTQRGTNPRIPTQLM